MKKAFLFSSLYYPNVGGVENSIKEFSLVLLSQGYEVTVLTSKRDNVDDQELPEIDCICGVKVIRCDYPRGRMGFLVFLKSLRKKIDELNISNSDFLMARSHWPVLALRSKGLTNVSYLVPSVYFFQERLSFNYFLSSKVVGYFLNSVSQFLALLFSNIFVFSEDMVRQVKGSSFGICEASILNPGVSKERFFPVGCGEKSSIKDRLGLSRSSKYLLCVGRVSEIKQFDLAVSALRNLDQRYSLIIVGSGPDLDSLKSLAKLEGVADNVVFVPFTKDVDLYYKAADFYLMTSRYESFGQVLLEATSCGLPVVAFSKASGVRTSVSYIYHGYDSLLTVCNDQTPLSLAETISELCIDKHLFDSEVSEFSKRYSWEHALNRMMKKSDRQVFLGVKE